MTAAEKADSGKDELSEDLASMTQQQQMQRDSSSAGREPCCSRLGQPQEQQHDWGNKHMAEEFEAPLCNNNTERHRKGLVSMIPAIWSVMSMGGANETRSSNEGQGFQSARPQNSKLKLAVASN